jgi:hypothetical protein
MFPTDILGFIWYVDLLITATTIAVIVNYYWQRR